ncbi:hypothetical protein ACE1B6_27440 [Aerosakkonemataceae cyanobacterium BLCC-F154]|uniref:Uncharacterized protein n=1 Tax=Floridaenema fluviatile BLCC-F154 TaxID=3153640 RepID=A0ABV4YJI8_9CYAN
MQTFTFHSQVNSDGILRLEIPVDTINTELQVTVKVEPVSSTPRSHADSKNRFQQMLKKYEGRTFSDSVELLREDRSR